jgi:hypothetical protein
MMEEWSLRMLDLLDAHFAAVPYLLGNHPTLADFSLQSTMYGHLGRDPWPKREWIDPRHHLRNWIDRMASLDHDAVRARYGAPTPDAPDDVIPPTLEPVLRIICHEFLPMVRGILDETRRAMEVHSDKREPLSRLLGPISFPMGVQGMPYPSPCGRSKACWMRSERCRTPTATRRAAGCVVLTERDFWISTSPASNGWRCKSG